MQSFILSTLLHSQTVIWVDLKRKTEIESYFWKPETHTSNCGQQIGCRKELQTCELLDSICTVTSVEPRGMDGFCMGATLLLIATPQTLLSGVPDSFQNGVSGIGTQLPSCKLSSLSHQAIWYLSSVLQYE